jgi:hypothetical protein
LGKMLYWLKMPVYPAFFYEYYVTCFMI